MIMSIGGSNRMLSIDDVADMLGVPRKSVAANWREWGLTGYRVGRHVRFRERAVQDWLEGRKIIY